MFFRPTIRRPALRLTTVTPTRAPAFELRIALRAPCGQVLTRTRLCWADTPSSAAVLEALLRRVSEARRRGLTLVVEEGPAELGSLLELAGVTEWVSVGEL
jgi:hypothetical protein